MDSRWSPSQKARIGGGAFIDNLLCAILTPFSLLGRFADLSLGTTVHLKQTALIIFFFAMH